MDDDAFPNFSNAYPAAVTPSSESASWNPALRPDSIGGSAPTSNDPNADEDDDFFERYPDATPKKDQIPQTLPSGVSKLAYEEPEDLQEIATVPPDGTDWPVQERKQSISVLQVFGVQQESIDTEDSRSIPTFSATAEGPLSRHGATGYEHSDDEKVDDEVAVFQPGDSAKEQEQNLEEALPDVEAVQELGSEAVQERDHVAPAPAWEDSLEPAAHYEHQGEITELDMAQDEDVAMPLMDDEEPPPTPGMISRAQTMKAHQSEAPVMQEQPPPPTLDRAFTTNFTRATEQSYSENLPEAGDNMSWPAAGDDATFGQLLDPPLSQESSYERPEPPLAKPRQRSDTAFLSRPTDTELNPVPTQLGLTQTADEYKAQETSQHTIADTEGSDQADIAAAFAAALDADDILGDDDLLLEEDEDEAEAPTDANTFFADDDELLEDDFLAEELQGPTHPLSTELRNNVESTAGHERQRPRPTHVDSFHGRSAGTPDTGLFDLLNEPGSLQEPQQPSRPVLQAAQSFADKAKGGYQSPYDLPMDVLKPKRPRAQPSSQNMSSQQPTPPPRRSSSFASQASQQPPAPPIATASQKRAPSISSVGSASSQPAQSTNGATSGKPASKPDSAFFADLPVTTKPRARATYTPQQQHSMVSPPPAQMHPRPPVGSSAPAVQPPRRPSSPAHPPAQEQVNLIMGGLRQPEKPPMFPDAPPQQSQAATNPVGPPATTRYSPATHQHNANVAPPDPMTQSRFSPRPPGPAKSTSKARYSPAPATSGYQPGPAAFGIPPPQASNTAPATSPPSSIPTTLPSRPSQQYAPRTSSPLAYAANHAPPNASTGKDLPATPPYVTPSGPLGSTIATSMSPPDRSTANKYAPTSVTTDAAREANLGPPLRPRTHSPEHHVRGPKFSVAQIDRSLSSTGQTGIGRFQNQEPQRSRAVLPHRRQFSRDLTFAAPQDERSQDPLQRWKGHPIFNWEASGKVVHSFPKQIPFYASGQMAPSIKCTPGDVVVQEAQNFLPMDEQDAKFPGPLPARSKGRKKDVVTWLGSKIESMEKQVEHSMLHLNPLPEEKKRLDEKVLLWKLMKLFVENDGTLEGNQKIEEEVRHILVPNLVQMSQIVDIPSPTSAGLQADAVDKAVLVQLRQALFEGHRERAVWLAEEKKLWGHAMLIASTMGPEVWKQIIQSFVRSNVKAVGSDARSMAALYQIFAGNADECVDELVPPSARAGFQMISKTDGVAKGNPLEGLDQWRETLALVSSNRTAQDGLSLLSLGKLLSGYGRVEAAHSCFLFARNFVKHSGADDAEAHFVLLGGNHQSSDETIASQLDTILLTEVYEYACSLSAPSSAMPYAPHLQAYKLVHAQELAAHGLKNKAQNYCQHIASAMSASTRGSPYYHANLAESVAGLNSFLSQTPDSGAGLFGKNSINKMSSGMGSWFSKFVAGDDAETASNASGPSGMSDAGGVATSGPFGGVQASGASISRPDSGMNMYAAMSGGISTPGGNAAPPMSHSAPFSPLNRYAPNAQPGQAVTRPQLSEQNSTGRYAPSTSTINSSPALRQRPSIDSDAGYHPELSSSLGIRSEPIRPGSSRSMSSSRYAPVPSSQHGLGLSHAGELRPPSENSAGFGEGPSRRGSAQSGLSNMSYEPKPILNEQQGVTFDYQPPSTDGAATKSPPNFDEPVTAGVHEDHYAAGLDVEEAVEEHDANAERSEGGYEPPTTSYEPPSYQPYDPDAEVHEPEQDDSRANKKKGIMDMDDDDDGEELAKRAAALKKAQADREADEAFRKAAEADAARNDAKGGEKKPGWFGGWFGKKDPNLAPGPVRAKLGEQNSFYYDEQLKKWVNKKGGAEAAASSAPTPPPPKGPPSRASGGGPPSGPPSRVGSGTGLAGLAGSRPPTSSGLAGPPSGPSSRTGTPGTTGPGSPELVPSATTNGTASAPPSTAPSIPPSRPGTGLSNASSIDDLLGTGPLGPRKGGTTRGKKKGGRYVDVMANK